MTSAEKHILYYNRLNGKSITIQKLKVFREQVEKTLDSNGHGPLTMDLKGILSRVTKAIKSMIANNAEVVDRIELVRVEISKNNPLIKPEAIIDEQELHGLEYIRQKETGLGFTKEGQQKIYDMVTEMILETMKQGNLFWREPWAGGGKVAKKVKVNIMGPLPVNFVSKAPYSGVNYWILKYVAPHRKGYTVLNYLTLPQINQIGGKIKKGAKAWPVIYYSLMYKYNGKNITEDEFEMLSEDEQKKAQKIPFIQYYNVFNAHDVEGVPGIMEQVQARKTVLKYDVDPIEAAESIVNGMPKKPYIQQSKQRRAYYSPGGDFVHMPFIGVFDKEQEYYSTFFHELVHSTGHESRLNRELSQEKKKYAFEELIAELGASYLCAEAGILYFTLKNSAAYLKGWSKRLREEMESDSKFFLKAAAKAQQASNFILDVENRSNKSDKKKVVPEAPKSARENKKSQRAPVKRKERSKATAETSTAEEKRFNDVLKYAKKYFDKPDTFGPETFREGNIKPASKALAKAIYERMFDHGSKASLQDLAIWSMAVRDASKMNELKTEHIAEAASMAIRHNEINRTRPTDTKSKATHQKSLSGVNYKYHEIDLGKYKGDFHRMFSDTIVQIHGLPGHGKTVWLLKYAQYRAEQGEKVLYVAREEYGRSVLDIKLKEHNIGHANLRFKGQLDPQDLKWATVVLLDSVSALDLNHKDVEKLSQQYPNRNWYLVLQSTKDGNFRGSQEWEHLVDVAGEIKHRKLILSKNRLDPNNKEKAEKLMVEAIVSDKKKAHEIKELVKKQTQEKPANENKV